MRLAIKVLVMDDAQNNKIVSVQKTALIVPDGAAFSARRSVPFLADGLAREAIDEYFEYLGCEELSQQDGTTTLLEMEQTHGNQS